MRVMVGAWAQRGTVYPQSPSCGRDSGVSVFGLAGAAPSPTRSLAPFFALCPGSCFSLSLFVLADTHCHLAAARSPRTCTRGRTRVADTRARPALFVLATARCHLPEPLNAGDQPNTPLVYTCRGHRTPSHPVHPCINEVNVWVSTPPTPI